MRLDVREDLERAAKAELAFNENFVLLVARSVAEEMAADWSRPVQMKVEILPDSALLWVTVRDAK